MAAPEWFVEAFRGTLRLVPPGQGYDDVVATRAQANALYEHLQEVGWEGHRLLGGKSQADGTLSKARKVPTLILPTTEEIPGGHAD